MLHYTLFDKHNGVTSIKLFWFFFVFCLVQCTLQCVKIQQGVTLCNRQLDNNDMTKNHKCLKTQINIGERNQLMLKGVVSNL
jgi:hypothetical protein